MSITLDPPSQLFFERPLTRPATEKLLLVNLESEPITFKVKTTSPKQYCVRPNSGRIEAGQKVEVQILLQPFKEEPPVDVKCKDKFLVLTSLIPPELSDLPFSQMWSVLESENKASIKEKKLKCVFLPPNDDIKSTNSTKREPSPTPPSYSPEASPHFSTVREPPTINRQPEEKKNLLPNYLPKVDDVSPSASFQHNQTSLKKADNIEVDSLQSELKQAKANIAQLEKDLESYKTKLKTAESKVNSNSTKQISSTANPDFNIQVLGAVAVIAFLLGSWLF